MTPPVAREVVLDERSGAVTVDGVTLPCCVLPDPSIELVASGMLITLTLTLPADRVVMVSRDDTRSEVETTWARMTPCC